MPPRLSIPLPKLTLFTGPECSLCDVAKAELVQIRKTHPFDIKLWNIRAPPPDSDEREAKKWRRLYQYEIPVLHLEDRQIAKHRIDQTKVKGILEEWKQQNDAGHSP